MITLYQYHLRSSNTLFVLYKEYAYRLALLGEKSVIRIKVYFQQHLGIGSNLSYIRKKIMPTNNFKKIAKILFIHCLKYFDIVLHQAGQTVFLQ